MYYFSNGVKYEGQIKNNTHEGYGIYYFPNGDRFEGIVKDNIFGHGTFFSHLGLNLERNFGPCITTKILLIIYQIILFFNKLKWLLIRNKITLFFIIILIIGIILN